MPEGADLQAHLDYLCSFASDLATMNAALDNREYIDIIFASLPDSYRMVVTTLEAHPENQLTEGFVISRLLKEELKKNRRRGNEATADGRGCVVLRITCEMLELRQTWTREA